MALIKDDIIDRIDVTESGALHVRRALYIVEDGVRIAGPHYTRVAYEPGRNVSHESQRVQDIANVVWTPDVLRAHEARKKANRARRIIGQ